MPLGALYLLDSQTLFILSLSPVCKWTGRSEVATKQSSTACGSTAVPLTVGYLRYALAAPLYVFLLHLWSSRVFLFKILGFQLNHLMPYLGNSVLTDKTKLNNRSHQGRSCFSFIVDVRGPFLLLCLSPLTMQSLAFRYPAQDSMLCEKSHIINFLELMMIRAMSFIVKCLWRYIE